MQAYDIVGQVFKNGSGLALARILGWAGTAIVQADVTAAEYTIYELDDDDVDSRDAVTGHEAVSLTVATVIYNALQTAVVWDVDATGYNFRHQIDVSLGSPFPTAGKTYLIEYTLTTSTQPILLRFKVDVL